MAAVSFDTFILLVLLVLVGIVLFLSLVTAIHVIRLSREIAFRQKREEKATGRNAPPAGSDVKNQADTVAAATYTPVAGRKRDFDVTQDAPDIPTGMKNLCAHYDLTSLSISSPDGLLIASSGYPGAINDAAQYSYAFQTGVPIKESGVQVFPVDFGTSPLVGILRSTSALPDTSVDSLQDDIAALLKRWI